MSDIRKKFHELALKSGLFKGRSDWYFCYLKSEKIAHVLIVLTYRSGSLQDPSVQDLVAKASLLPQIIARLAAGQTTPEGVLADMFGLLTALRLCTTQGFLSRENSAILEGEYEQLVEKISASNVVSPFLSSEDFSLPELPDGAASLDDQLSDQSLLPASSAASYPSRTQKDNHKGQDKRHQKDTSSESQRTSTILTIVRKNKGVSVGDIAAVVKDCSEKTIQRELSNLIDRGLVRKQGERRWSIYLPA
jgi:hypothetical protein